MTNTDQRSIEIANTIYHQLQQLNRANGFPFKFSDALADNVHENTSLQVTVKKTGSYIYKFFVKYDEANDLYNVRFGYMYSGSNISREDWCVFYITEWTEGIYADMMLDCLQDFWNNRNKKDYHNIADEYKTETVENQDVEQEVTETNDYEEMLKAAGWID